MSVSHTNLTEYLSRAVSNLKTIFINDIYNSIVKNKYDDIDMESNLKNTYKKLNYFSSGPGRSKPLFLHDKRSNNIFYEILDENNENITYLIRDQSNPLWDNSKLKLLSTSFRVCQRDDIPKDELRKVNEIELCINDYIHEHLPLMIELMSDEIKSVIKAIVTKHISTLCNETYINAYIRQHKRDLIPSKESREDN